MAIWRLITTWGADPAFNMGLDGALLESRDAPPTLRFYSWRPDTLSLGYFQPYGSVPGIERAGAVVRRITGGGAIHHVHELTFSLAVGLDHPLYAGPVAQSYARVHAAVVAALAEHGVQAALRGAGALASDVEGTGMCFHRSTALDLAWEGRKGVGSAQRRKDGRVLHHGSIKLASSVLEGSIATVARPGARMRPEDLAPALRSAFERVLGLRLEAGVPEPEERDRARVLGLQAMDPQFLRRR